MPKRKAFGTNLGTLLSGRKRDLPAAIRQAMHADTRIEALESRTLLSTTWYVSTSGNDSNSGAFSAPFHTIQHAASIAHWGDTVMIFGGTYHEQVHPNQGGITFQAYNNQNVVVSGADPIGSWGGYSGSIYQSYMPWDLGEGNNQVFVNGQMINEARWPNTSTNLTWPSTATVQGGGGNGNTVTIYDSHLSGGWTGGYIQILPGSGWYNQTGSIVGSGNGWLTFDYSQDTTWTAPRAGNSYYLFGKLQGLDSPGEWYRDSSGHLYLWAPNSANPNSLDIEVKHRDYAFDLSGDANITLNGINIFAATIKTDGGSSHLVINNMRATYISQSTWLTKGWSEPNNDGIELNGSNSLLENSTIAWSAGDGVYISGGNSRVTNTVIHDVDYGQSDSAAIHNYGSNVTIDHNLIYNAARDGIIDQGWGAQIISNTIHDVMLQTADGGGIYTVSQNGSGSLIAWNAIYNIHEHVNGDSPEWFSANGIFLDNSASNWTIENNVIANVDGGIKMNFWSTGNKVENNQIAGNVGSIVGNGNTGSWAGGVITGNTLYNSIALSNPGAYIAYNNYASGSPNISSTGTPSADPLPPSASSGSGSPSSSGSSSSASSSTYATSSSSSNSTSSGSSSQGGSSSKSNNSSQSGGSSGASKTGGNSGTSSSGPRNDYPFTFIGPTRAPVPDPVSAFAPIAAGKASASLGTAPTPDGSVIGAAGNWLKFTSVNFGGGAAALNMVLAAVGKQTGLRVQLRLDNAKGAVIGTVKPPTAKRAKSAQMQSTKVKKVTGIHDLYLVFVGHSGELSVQSFQFLAPPPVKSK
ncbi:MAG TPA: carbohydrate-binding protein [Tepidisphaeraceae bacterium]|jgi:hypothetical protein|nr:carbohydrate-binding protein [Tepidisphaeraceae bacterium]